MLEDAGVTGWKRRNQSVRLACKCQLSFTAANVISSKKPQLASSMYSTAPNPVERMIEKVGARVKLGCFAL